MPAAAAVWRGLRSHQHRVNNSSNNNTENNNGSVINAAPGTGLQHRGESDITANNISDCVHLDEQECSSSVPSAYAEPGQPGWCKDGGSLEQQRGSETTTTTPRTPGLAFHGFGPGKHGVHEEET